MCDANLLTRSQFIKRLLVAVAIAGCVVVLASSIRHLHLLADMVTTQTMAILAGAFVALVLLSMLADYLRNQYRQWRSELSETDARRLKTASSIARVAIWLFLGALFYHLYVNQRYVELIIFSVINIAALIQEQKPR